MTGCCLQIYGDVARAVDCYRMSLTCSRRRLFMGTFRGSIGNWKSVPNIFRSLEGTDARLHSYVQLMHVLDLLHFRRDALWVSIYMYIYVYNIL
jgi:hypothetical protein